MILLSILELLGGIITNYRVAVSPGLLGGTFNFYLTFDRTFCSQTVKTWAQNYNASLKIRRT